MKTIKLNPHIELSFPVYKTIGQDKNFKLVVCLPYTYTDELKDARENALNELTNHYASKEFTALSLISGHLTEWEIAKISEKIESKYKLLVMDYFFTYDAPFSICGDYNISYLPESLTL